MISIISYNPCENNSIRMIKNKKPSKDENGHWKGEKGEQGLTS